MGEEIERKFRVANEGWREGEGTLFRQGYLSTDKHRTVRVRIEGDRAKITIKGITEGIRRREFEYEIPVGDAETLLEELCKKPLIEKRRHLVRFQGSTWEIDEFFGENEGLVIAEIELLSEEEDFDPPPWLGKEVSHDPRFYNASLVANPYTKWEREGE